MVLKAKTTRREHSAKTAALEEAGKEDTKRLNAEIPISLHTAIKMQASKEQSSMTDILVQALNEYLSKNS